MRYIIVSEKAGTFIGSTYGGDFFAEYGASTYSETAWTFATEEEARKYAARFAAEDDLGELAYLPVNSPNDEATMAQCVTAGAAAWRHHVASGSREPRREPINLPKSLYFGHVGHRATSFVASLLPNFVRKDGSVFAIDKDVSHQVVFAPTAVGASLLVHMTEDEVLALDKWCAEQPDGDGTSSGACELMKWPGWQAVAQRRADAKRGKLVDMEGRPT